MGFNAKKATLDQLGVTSVAVDELQKQKTASDGPTTALLSKVPAIAKPIARKSTDEILQTLDMGITALQAPAAAKASNKRPASAAAQPAGDAAAVAAM